jgi:hypothetical protein
MQIPDIKSVTDFKTGQLPGFPRVDAPSAPMPNVGPVALKAGLKPGAG